MKAISLCTRLAPLALAFTFVACAAPLSKARVSGDVSVDAKHDRYHGAPIELRYRAREADQLGSCSSDWAGCLARSSQWSALDACSDGPSTSLRIIIGESQHAFAGCTGLLGSRQRVDVAAFIDLDGSGTMDAGEPFGVLAGAELDGLGALRGPLHIAIDDVTQATTATKQVALIIRR